MRVIIERTTATVNAWVRGIRTRQLVVLPVAGRPRKDNQYAQRRSAVCSGVSSNQVLTSAGTHTTTRMAGTCTGVARRSS